MHTRESVAHLCRNLVQTAIAILCEVVFYCIIVKRKNSIVAVGSQHREIGCTLQQGDEVPHPVAIGLQELCGSHLAGLVIVLGYIVVVIDAACKGHRNATANRTGKQ